MKIAVILNNDAEAIRNKNEEYTPEIIYKKFNSLNIESEIKSVEGKYLVETAEQFMNGGFNAIIAAGGDGTVSSIASVLSESAYPLGILPFGTLNHFARDLNLPLDFDKAVETISAMKVKKIDVGEVNGKVFINNSSIGFYPEIIKHRKINSKKLGLNKWVAMFIAFINVFRRFPVAELKLHSEKDIVKIKTPFVFIGNNDYQVDLFNIGRRTNIDKGRLSIYFPNTTGKISMLKFALLALSNNLEQARNFVVDSSDSIILETKKKHLRVSLDGEIYKFRTPLHYRIKPLSLKVIVPK